MTLSRRSAVLGAAAIGAAGAGLAPTPSARAAAPATGKQAPGFFRYRIGDFEVTTFNDGHSMREVNAAFVPNAGVDDVKKTLSAAFMPTDRIQSHFNQTLINTGSKLILIDCGFNDNGIPTTGNLAGHMAAAGIDPKSIDIVLISHFHGDHINGLRAKVGAAVYPNAEIKVPAPEWTYWMDDGRMNGMPEAARGGFVTSRRVFMPMAKDLTQFEWGKEVAPGITSVRTDGHTPGHASFMVSSGKSTLLVVGDACNDPRVFARNPEWQFVADVDKPLAVTNRKKLFDQAATDRTQVVFYHAAFPATGFLTKAGAGYDFVPAPWSPVL